MNLPKFSLLWLSFVLLLGLAACQPSFLLKTQDNEQLYQEVMDLHDTVMLRTNKDIPRERQALRQLLADLEEDNQPRRDSLVEALRLLQKAEDEMMDWMRDFKGRDLSETFYQERKAEEIDAYLREQGLSMAKIGALTNQAIERAQALRQ